jgi:RHS repeat-associated protein
VSTVYDADSNVVQTIDELGQKTTYSYDSLNRPSQTIDPRGGITTTVYDADSNTVNVIDADGNKTTFSYDAANELTQQTDALGHSATFAYDQAGRLSSTTDRDGRLRTFRYDADNRETGETWTASGSTQNVLTFSYDGVGNVLTAADYAGTYTMSYDALNRVSVTQEPFGQTLTATYDAAGNRTQFQDSQGGLQTSVYDALNRLTTRKETGQAPLRLDFTYTARDDLASVSRYSDLAGTTTVAYSAYSYDSMDRITNLQHQNGSGTNLANFTYTYDLASRVTTEMTNGTAKTYAYDAGNELTNDGTKTYSYDATGNRSMTGYQTGTGNQLQNDGVYTYTYDSEGNLTQKSAGPAGDTWQYGYDNKNHLVSVEHLPTNSAVTMIATYVYDAFGNRVEKDVEQGGVTTVTRFAYDGNEVWADLSGSNALVTRYFHGDQTDQLFVRVSSTGTVAWYLTDRLGSVRNLTDNSGVVQDTITYDGYGNATETNAAGGDRYKFTGRELDSETGLQYNRARYYDPAAGRWTSQDPMGFGAGDTNLYRYVFNSPANYLDPTGQDTAWRQKMRQDEEEFHRKLWELPKRPYQDRLAQIEREKKRADEYLQWLTLIRRAEHQVGVDHGEGGLIDLTDLNEKMDDDLTHWCHTLSVEEEMVQREMNRLGPLPRPTQPPPWVK